MRRLAAAAAVLLALSLLGWASVPATADPVATSVITHADLTTDIRITGTQAAPQVLLTTPPVQFDGGPVVVDFVAEYLNHIPAPGTQLNGVAFVLLIDGVMYERLTLAGTHSQDNSFWPIVLRDYLDCPPRMIPAGTHTVGIAVWKWSSTQDGYLKYDAGMQPGWGMPIRLTVSRA